MKVPFDRTVKRFLMERQAKRLLKGWRFSGERVDILIREYVDMKRLYLPVDMRGKTVLDVGAGEGESALFFLAHGARKVICVEADRACYENLVCNAKGKPIVPILKPFSLDDLERDFDFMKCDIEGYEEILLDVVLDKPAVVEVHGLQLRDKFVERGYRASGLFREDKPFHSHSISYVYWRCFPQQ